MAKVELKQPVVAEIAEVLNGAKSAVVVDYRGLTVEQDTALRKQLREAGVSYKVYKNTMIRFAAKGTEGPTLPAFLSQNVLNYLVENFGIAAITTPEEDLKTLLG